MLRLRKYITGHEKGQVLLTVLITLVLGGLLVASSLGYTDSGLRSRMVLRRNIEGVYAADAGIEDVIFCLANDLPTRSALPQNINGMQVAMQTELMGTYTMIAGEFDTPGGHSGHLLVDGSMVWDAGANAYKYTITVTRNCGYTVALVEVGARLPPGYEYQPGSAASFGGNLSTAEPTDVLDGGGAHLLRWVFSPPRPQLNDSNPVRTQVFYATGEGSLSGHYAWAVAAEADIGAVSNLTGIFYVVTATATDPQDGSIAARIVANVMYTGVYVSIVSWQISSS